MLLDSLFDDIPLWGWALLTLISLFSFYEGGFQLGKNRLLKGDKDFLSAPLFVAGILGVTGLVLTLALMMASSSFEEKRRLTWEDANTIEAAYLQAAYLPEVPRSTVRALLREYVNVRLQTTRPIAGESPISLKERVGQGVVKSESLQEELWNQAILIASQDHQSVTNGLFLHSLSELIALHSTRTSVSFRSQIPSAIWLGVYGLSFLSMSTIGYYSGWTHSRSHTLNLFFALALSSVILLARGLDRPWGGFFHISQQPLINLAEKIDAL